MKVRYAARSLRDLEKIRTYIAEEAGDQHVANHFLNALFEECEFLAVLPERYPVYRHAPRWRMMPFANYLVFYRVKGQEVQVGHVRHAARWPFCG